MAENPTPTWEWVARILVTLLLGLLSYSAVQLQDRVGSAEEKAVLAEHKADLLQSTVELQNKEIIRRLEKLEDYQERILARVSPQTFPTGRKPPVEFGR